MRTQFVPRRCKEEPSGIHSGGYIELPLEIEELLEVGMWHIGRRKSAKWCTSSKQTATLSPYPRGSGTCGTSSNTWDLRYSISEDGLPERICCGMILASEYIGGEQNDFCPSTLESIPNISVQQSRKTETSNLLSIKFPKKAHCPLGFAKAIGKYRTSSTEDPKIMPGKPMIWTFSEKSRCIALHRNHSNWNEIGTVDLD